MRRPLFFAYLIFLTCLVFAPAASLAKKKKYPALANKGMQRQEIAGADAQVVASKAPCINYAWVAVLDAMLQAQSAQPMPQSEWAVKISGGDKCFTRVADYSSFMRTVEGDYYLPDRRKIKITLPWTPGPPTETDPIIFSLRSKRPLMLLWKQRPYLIYGVSYGELVAPSGHSFFSIEEMKLIDPSLPESSAGHRISFLRGRDDPAEIQGVMDVKIQ